MKTGVKCIFLLAAAGLMAACSNHLKPEEDHEGHDHQEVVSASKNTAVTLKNDQLNAVYPHYNHLTTALINGDAAEAKVAASAIEIGAKQLEGGTALERAAARITEDKKLESQRATFAALNREFIAMLKKTGLESGELFVAHCPMALHDKGADWVSNSKEIRNPYFGESMLTCGSVKETIK